MHSNAGLVQAYYDSWSRGGAAFDEARLRDTLAPDLRFDGPIAGTRTGAEAFLARVGSFAKAIVATRMLREVHADTESAMLYDCDFASGGTLRFAEFIRVAGGKIAGIALVFDAAEFRKLIART